MECPNCHKEVQPNWSKCPYCKTELKSTMDSPEVKQSPLQVFKNKAIWSIVPGEIAYHVRESELDNFDQISGIIIEEGISAFIYIDGTRVAELGSGAYEFTSKEKINQLLNTHLEGTGLIDTIKQSWRAIVSLVTGKKVGKNVSPDVDLHDVKSVEDVIKYLRKDSVISIYLKLNKTFPALFGLKPGTTQYAPLAIRTAISDIQLGVTAQMQIADFNAFIPHYLVGKKHLTMVDVQHEIAADVEAILKRTLANETVDERGITDSLFRKIEEQLLTLNSVLNGLAITRIVDITCQNEDFERFRALAKELYLEERELDYMRRSQEMKNRLVTFENEQVIYSARSKYELTKAMDAINKDNLLERDEMRRFEMMVEAQWALAQSKSEMDTHNALNDLRRSGMVSDDAVDQLANELLAGKIQRESVTNLLVIDAARRSEEAKTDMEIMLQRKKDDYIRQTAFENAKTEDEIARLKAARLQEQANSALDRLAAMKRIRREDEMERKDQDYRHEENMATDRYKHEENIERIKAEVAINDSQKEIDAIRAQQAKQEELYRSMNDERKSMYSEMMGNMKEMVIGTAAVTRGQEVPFNGNAPQASNASYFLPMFGNVPFNLEQIRSFITNGTVQADTLIRKNGQDWQASTMTEFADLFTK